MFQNETKRLPCLVFALVNARTMPIETKDERRKTRDERRENGCAIVHYYKMNNYICDYYKDNYYIYNNHNRDNWRLKWT